VRCCGDDAVGVVGIHGNDALCCSEIPQGCVQGIGLEIRDACGFGVTTTMTAHLDADGDWTASARAMQCREKADGDDDHEVLRAVALSVAVAVVADDAVEHSQTSPWSD
jgi:hypothetical protein